MFIKFFFKFKLFCLIKLKYFFSISATCGLAFSLVIANIILNFLFFKIFFKILIPKFEMPKKLHSQFD